MFKLEPVFKDYIWGGNRLKNDFNKKSDLEVVAESWELCCHKNGTNQVTELEISLEEYLQKNPKALGENCSKFGNFPVLIKLIDAKDNLSIQVHPDDEYAKKYENSFGKTEMWYVVDCEPDAYLYYGFNKTITKDEFKKRIEENALLEVLNKVPIKKGDMFFITAGTIHAICKGTLIAEIQQNSDITYRVYDYGRIGKDGKARELHVERAMEVSKLEKPKEHSCEVIEKTDKFEKILLSKCEFFETYKLNIKEGMELGADKNSFNSILCLDGEMTISSNKSKLNIKKGDSVFVPSGEGNYIIEGNGELILTLVP